MKSRIGFVSNSSSSSFLLRMDDMTTEQIDAVKNHAKVWSDIEDVDEKANIYGWWIRKEVEDFSSISLKQNEWGVEEDRGILKVYTSMDNFDMGYFLEYIKVPNKAILHYRKD